MTAAFATATFALVGFEDEEATAISSLLSGLGSLSHNILPQATAFATQTDSYSAIVLNLRPLTDSPWKPVENPLALQAPWLVVGTFDDLNRYPAIQANASEVLYRPLAFEELVARIGRCLARSTAARKGPARKPRILIADDDTAMVGLVSGILRSRGFECHQAQNGREALDLARTLLPDLLILDLNMPLINGFDVLSALREDPSTSAMKILMFTATGAPAVVKRGGELGADSYLCKPFRPFDFLQRVRALLPGVNPVALPTFAPGAWEG